jgi:hypothetical protein
MFYWSVLSRISAASLLLLLLWGITFWAMLPVRLP